MPKRRTTRRWRSAGRALGAVASLATLASPAVARFTAQPAAAATSAPAGFWLATASGTVVAVGTTAVGGYAPATPPRAPVVSLVATPDARGYWLTTSTGQVMADGDAAVLGSAPSPLNRPVVGMDATSDGAGYWLVASDGGVFTFGTARFYGSTGAMRLNRPIVGMAATPDNRGYWLVASDGGVFTFGDARFFGSTGSLRLARPIVGMAATPDAAGYWLVASDGGVFTFGDARFYGSGAATPLAAPVVGMAATPDGAGYWMATSGGQALGFGEAAGTPGTTGSPAAQPAVTLVADTVAIAAPGPPPAAARAVQFALAQLGKPYVWGGTGPDGYDCSGLVMASYAAAGIQLPRIAQDQYDAGPAVPVGAPLAPGDVVFFGTPTGITHDGIYLGNGQMVDAPHTGTVVRIESYQWTDYVGATRPAG